MILTPEQQRVYDWLASKVEWKGGRGLPVYAEVYKGALHLLKTKPPGYITFVAHAGRELMNGLAPTFAGIQRSQAQYYQHVDKLQGVWKEEWRGRGFTPRDSDGKGHCIPYDICQMIQELIDEHKAGRERRKQLPHLFFTSFLDYEDHEQVPRNFVNEWEDASDWLHPRYAHLRSGRFHEDVPSEVERHFRTLDGLLYVAASSEFERLRGIDEILEEANR